MTRRLFGYLEGIGVASLIFTFASRGGWHGE
jgi:hypothetical protein